MLLKMNNRQDENLQNTGKTVHDITEGLSYLNETEAASQKTWELFKYFRSETQHEHTLLLGRVSWYITCQSFLITVYAISFSNSRHPNWFSNIVLPGLAIIVSVLAFFMIEGATVTINMWGRMRNDLVQVTPKLDSVIIPRWRSHAKFSDPIHVRALWFPRLITIVFIFFGSACQLRLGSTLGYEF
jgi:hypothetical protein